MGVAAAIPEVVGVGAALSSLLGGNPKDKTRDAQEAQRFSQARGGDVTAAQGIYHDGQAQSGQTKERIKDDSAYWPQLVALGWTVNTSVHNPSDKNTEYGTVYPPTTTAGRQSGIAVATTSVPANQQTGNYYTNPGQAPNPYLTTSAAPLSIFSAASGGTGLVVAGVAGLTVLTLVLVIALRR